MARAAMGEMGRRCGASAALRCARALAWCALKRSLLYFGTSHPRRAFGHAARFRMHGRMNRFACWPNGRLDRVVRAVAWSWVSRFFFGWRTQCPASWRERLCSIRSI